MVPSLATSVCRGLTVETDAGGHRNIFAQRPTKNVSTYVSAWFERVQWSFPPFRQTLKALTDEQVFYEKFLCDKFTLPSLRVYAQHFLYDKFL